MTLSAWRPLKDAPKNLPAYVETDNGTHVAQWDGEWLYWPDDNPRYLSEDTPSLPIADTYELDRAVQGEIVRAFTVILSVLVDDERMRIGAARRGKPGECFQLFGGYILREAAGILHTAMGGRIPDEVPHAEYDPDPDVMSDPYR